jgi:hypothetical protein
MTGIYLDASHVRRYISIGHIGMGALSSWNPGRISAYVCEHLKKSLLTCTDLIQFEGKRMTTSKDLSIRFDTVVNSKPGEKEKNGYNLLERIKKIWRFSLQWANKRHRRSVESGG